MVLGYLPEGIQRQNVKRLSDEHALDAGGLTTVDHVHEVRATTTARLEQVADCLVSLPPRPVIGGVRAAHHSVLGNRGYLQHEA